MFSEIPTHTKGPNREEREGKIIRNKQEHTRAKDVRAGIQVESKQDYRNIYRLFKQL